MRPIVATFLVLGIFIVPWIGMTFPDASSNIAAVVRDVGSQVAAVLLYHKPVTVESMKTNYAMASLSSSRKVRVLVVAGHEPSYGGAEYGSIKERNLTVELADSLVDFLNKDGHFAAFTTRTKSYWNPEFESYFNTYWDDINEWQKAHTAEVLESRRLGKTEAVTPTVYHNAAPKGIVTRLYGISKWVNENDVDIAIHVHFNDYPRDDANSPGKYSGFAIYVPEKQYFNSSSTKVVAETVFKRLSKYNPISNLKGESSGILEDQDLIAVGSYNSVDAASMLIEYSYIYEPQILDERVRHTFLKELAYETYLGLVDFFDPTNSAILGGTYDTLTLPHHFSSDANAAPNSPTEIFALQSALINHGDYPPVDQSLNDCPRTGRFGGCTKKALSLFQNKISITGEKDVIGPRTAWELNQLYAQ